MNRIPRKKDEIVTSRSAKYSNIARTVRALSSKMLSEDSPKLTFLFSSRVYARFTECDRILGKGVNNLREPIDASARTRARARTRLQTPR